MQIAKFQSLRAPESIAGAGGAQSAKDGADTRNQLAGIERFCKIVVCAVFETKNAVYVFATRGEHQHANARRAPDCMQHLQTIHSWQHHIQDHDVVFPGECLLQPVASFVDQIHVEAFLNQVLSDQFAQFAVIVDN
jgi:hypothetical protein